MAARGSTRRQVLAACGSAGAALILPASPRLALGQSRDAGLTIIRAGPDATPPLIRVRRGEPIAARLVNALAEPIALHWHGLRLPAAIDGRDRPPLPPGASADYRFTPPDAGTFWYHAGQTAASPLLRGLVIIDEATATDVDQDIAAMLSAGATGLTVNGQQNLDIPVRTHDRVRLRLVNAVPAQPLALRIVGQDAWVMAIDGQPAEPFLARDGGILLGPGNRIDLFIDAASQPGARVPVTVESVHGERAVLHLLYKAVPGRPARRPDPAPLPPNPLPARMDFRGALRIDLGLIDDGFASPGTDAPAFTAPRGRTVMAALANRAAAPWTVHVHGHAFRLLDRLDDGWKPFWLDTLVVPPGQTSRIAFVADNPGAWALDAERIGGGAQASRWFQVT